MNTEKAIQAIRDIEVEIEGWLDGAPDASKEAKLATRIWTIINPVINSIQPLPYALPKGSMTPITDTAEFTDGHASTLNPMVHSVIARYLEIENNQLKDVLKNLRDYCAAQGWDISTSNRVDMPENLAKGLQ